MHDSALLIEQISDLDKLDIKISEAIADKAYGSGELLTQLQEMSIETNIPLFNSRSGSSKRTYIPGFTYNAEKNYGSVSKTEDV